LGDSFATTLIGQLRARGLASSSTPRPCPWSRTFLDVDVWPEPDRFPEINVSIQGSRRMQLDLHQRPQTKGHRLGNRNLARAEERDIYPSHLARGESGEG